MLTKIKLQWEIQSTGFRYANYHLVSRILGVNLSGVNLSGVNLRVKVCCWSHGSFPEASHGYMVWEHTFAIV